MGNQVGWKGNVGGKRNSSRGPNLHLSIPNHEPLGIPDIPDILSDKSYREANQGLLALVKKVKR